MGCGLGTGRFATLTLAGARPRVNAPKTCTGGEYGTPVQYMPVGTILSSRDWLAPLAMPVLLVGSCGVGILPT
jgi:hypothetical protein